MNVRDVMNAEPITVEPRALLVEAARKMVENDVGFLPVIDNGILVGVVTDRDIVARGVAAACNLSQAAVGRCHVGGNRLLPCPAEHRRGQTPDGGA